MIKAICFDLDGVYFTKKGMEVFQDVLVRLGANREDVHSALYSSNEMMALKKGDMQGRDFVAYLNSFLHISLSKEEFMNYLAEGYEVNEEIKEYILKLRIKGFKTCVCSNNYELRVNALDAKFDFLNDFDFKIFSYQTRYMKPDVLMFQELVKATRLRPEEIAYSDDNYEKLTGALALGINTFVYQDFEQFKEELKKLGVKA